MSASEFHLYTSLGQLLRHWRSVRDVSQDNFAEAIRISVRQVRRWEASQHSVGSENLSDIAEYTRMPMPVLVALNAQQPMYYSIRKRRYVYSKTDPSNLIDPTNLSSAEDETGIIGSTVFITSIKQVKAILDYDHDIYPTQRPVSEELVLTSAELIQEMNLFCIDTWGHYAGHMVCFPLSIDFYKSIRSQSISEGDLKPIDLISPQKKQPVVFYIYSIYACYSGFANLILRRASAFLLSSSQNIDSIVAGYAVTKDAIRLCYKLQMSEVFSNPYEQETLCTEVIPTLFEGTIRSIKIAMKS